MAEKELLTGKKIAEKIGVSLKKVTDYIEDKDVKPIKCCGRCKYYGPKTVSKIEKALM